MKRQLGWRTVSREDLARHLQDVEILTSEAVGDTSVYRCQKGSNESIAVSLAGEKGLIIEVSLRIPRTLERRRVQEDNAPPTGQ